MTHRKQCQQRTHYNRTHAHLCLSLNNKSVEEVSICECLCVIGQFSPGMGCHENIASSRQVRSRADGVVKEGESFCVSQ